MLPYATIGAPEQPGVTVFPASGKGEALGQGFGRIVLVSGGSRGIGATTVRRLASDGWDIGFCHHHYEQSAVEVEKVASELGARVLAVQADLTRAGEVTSWVQRAEEYLGPVRALVSSRESPGTSRWRTRTGGR